MRRRFHREVAAAGLPAGPPPGGPVAEGDLDALPGPARAWLRAAGVVGRPRDWSFRARLRLRFRAAPGARWQRVEALQYTSGWPEVARIFHMRLRFRGIPVQGRDTYVRGAGRLRIRPLDLVTARDLRGPEMDLGELVTWLNDAVLLAPSMLLVPAVSWADAGPDAFDLALVDRGNVVRARVVVGGDGRVTDFRTEDRWYADPGSGELVPTPWSTPVAAWQQDDGRLLPTTARATWLHPGGDHTYAELALSPGDIAFNVPPQEA